DANEALLDLRFMLHRLFQRMYDVERFEAGEVLPVDNFGARIAEIPVAEAGPDTRCLRDTHSQLDATQGQCRNQFSNVLGSETNASFIFDIAIGVEQKP